MKKLQVKKMQEEKVYELTMDEHVKKWKLDAEERELLEWMESGNYTPLRGAEEKRMRELLRNSARAHNAKTRTISFRTTDSVYNGIRARAMREGLPYQTYINSVLHKLVNSPV